MASMQMALGSAHRLASALVLMGRKPAMVGMRSVLDLKVDRPCKWVLEWVPGWLNLGSRPGLSGRDYSVSNKTGFSPVLAKMIPDSPLAYFCRQVFSFEKRVSFQHVKTMRIPTISFFETCRVFLTLL